MPKARDSGSLSWGRLLERQGRRTNPRSGFDVFKEVEAGWWG